MRLTIAFAVTLLSSVVVAFPATDVDNEHQVKAFEDTTNVEYKPTDVHVDEKNLHLYARGTPPIMADMEERLEYVGRSLLYFSLIWKDTFKTEEFKSHQEKLKSELDVLEQEVGALENGHPLKRMLSEKLQFAQCRFKAYEDYARLFPSSNKETKYRHWLETVMITRIYLFVDFDDAGHPRPVGSRIANEILNYQKLLPLWEQLFYSGEYPPSDIRDEFEKHYSLLQTSVEVLAKYFAEGGKSTFE
ncbi:hypothetical protein JCM33374_g2300 [Metschnikowia sp. JCM 33374]|nr:hypothetical protein JCM33374_g2300 [Metschnikowia sp. JCM 33374]